MSIGLTTLLIFVVFLFFMALALPVAFSLFASAMIFALILIGPKSLYMLYSSTYSTMTTEIFISIPLFVFMAFLIQFSGIAAALYDAMYKWFGPLRGATAIGTVAICTLIAAMTGLGATGVVTMGVIALPEMLKRGYDKGLAVGCIPPGGALGPLIPPSVPMIVTAAFARLSVGKMFIGGIISRSADCIPLLRLHRPPGVRECPGSLRRSLWKSRRHGGRNSFPSGGWPCRCFWWPLSSVRFTAVRQRLPKRPGSAPWAP